MPASDGRRAIRVVNLKAATAYVENRGGLIERTRLKCVLTGETPSREAVEALLAGQRPDGGWPQNGVPDYSSLDCTCTCLFQAEEMGLTSFEPAIAQALRFLTQYQRPDGSWEEDAAFEAIAPPWARPGYEPARIFLTAYCGFWLAMFQGTNTQALRAAGYLQARLSEDGHLPTFPHGHWIAGSLWYRLGSYDVAERVFAYLDKRVQQMHPSHLAWLISDLRMAVVPASHYLVAKAASQLGQWQRGDGSWEAEDGPDFDIHATIEAVRALRLCGKI